ncbi:MAG: hypothetical protein PUD40_03100 [Bacteroidales bacterium]|nr:hypothetical protein [Bacteroidales bacterium]
MAAILRCKGTIFFSFSFNKWRGSPKKYLNNAVIFKKLPKYFGNYQNIAHPSWQNHHKGGFDVMSCRGSTSNGRAVGAPRLLRRRRTAPRAAAQGRCGQMLKRKMADLDFGRKLRNFTVGTEQTSAHTGLLRFFIACFGGKLSGTWKKLHRR